ncbi:hypothetical protein RHGRI_028847 [Rhododendron griersonianum]|uniref:Uncharacterized protein n=1 Tax=Rhododendron griersonianum TaxID=479676 RepID=A0AAV6IHA0_9ERIC|nr:hypothetical protein RHGRI_028847 [Rhododendron griersonianum]
MQKIKPIEYVGPPMGSCPSWYLDSTIINILVAQHIQSTNINIDTGYFSKALESNGSYVSHQVQRHAHSEILLNKGRLRLIRNSDGEAEGEVNAGAERRARIAAAALVPANSRKEKEVRQKRRNRLKKKKGEDANLDKASLSAKHPAKKRLKASDKYVDLGCRIKKQNMDIVCGFCVCC